MSETIIQAETLGKRYRLGVINRGMLYKDIQSWWAKVRGREDPNTPVHLAGKRGSTTGETFWAFRDVSFSVKRGEILGIIGRNGAGKSTLLKVLSQITAPSEGAFKLKGRVASLLEVGTGFHGELTGRENIYLNAAILGMSRADVKTRFDEIVDFAEIAKFVDTPVKRYSSGMYVRLAFAVAAHLDPDILIIDEVLAVGDAAFREKCVAKMGEVASGGRTVLFVSHNTNLVANLCTRALVLENGGIVYDGPVHRALARYNKAIGIDEATSTKVTFKNKADSKTGSILEVKFSKERQCEDPNFCISEDLLIEMKIRSCNPTGILVPGIQVHNHDGVTMFVSSPRNLKTTSPGEYTATVTIPAWTLNSGSYIVDATLCEHWINPSKYVVLDNYYAVLSFSVIEAPRTAKDTYGYDGKIPGLMRPRLDWSINRST